MDEQVELLHVMTEHRHHRLMGTVDRPPELCTKDHPLSTVKAWHDDVDIYPTGEVKQERHVCRNCGIELTVEY